MQRRLSRKLRLYGEPRAHDLRGIGGGRDSGDRRKFRHWARTDEGAFPDVPPELALALHDGKRLAKVAARDTEQLGEFALGRQARRRRQRPLGEPGA